MEGEVMELLRQTILIGGLMINSLYDLWKKQISLIVVIGMAVCGLLMRLVSWMGWGEFALSLLPGVICLFLAYISHEQIGYGDGWVILAIGCLCPMSEVISLTMTALLLIGPMALFLFVVRRKSKNFEIPFIPFLFAAYLVGLLV